MRAFNSVAQVVFEFAETRRRRHTARMIENLPFDVRKDIGWPHGQRRSSAPIDQWR